MPPPYRASRLVSACLAGLLALGLAGCASSGDDGPIDAEEEESVDVITYDVAVETTDGAELHHRGISASLL